MTQSIVLVDDDQNILTSVSMALETEGYQVRSYSDSEEALEALIQRPADIAILDIKMPRLTGMELLQRLRYTESTHDMPIVFLTSKDEEVDEIMGLSMGADDYITKPFSHRLLLERIRAILRREKMRLTPPETQKSDVMKRGNLVLDEDRHHCAWKGKDVDLTVTEFLLIKTLAQRAGHVKSRDQLMDAAYGDSVYVDDRTIDSHIKRLRKKFRSVDPEFEQIETLYGVGYRYKEG